MAHDDNTPANKTRDLPPLPKFESNGWTVEGKERDDRVLELLNAVIARELADPAMRNEDFSALQQARTAMEGHVPYQWRERALARKARFADAATPTGVEA